MYKYQYCFAVCLIFCFAASSAFAQATAKLTETKPAAIQPDYSKEAFIDEDDVTKVSFETDGTGTREWLLRIRIQSDAGLQRYSVLTFPYASATDSVDIDYVRVRKPDGTVMVTPADSFQDMPSEITRQAPFYSDQHEKHVAVKGLAVGDVLEAHAQWQVKKPLASGQFWSAFNFTHDFIVLHQEFQVSVPKDRAVKWKSLTVKPVIAEEGTRRIFTWTSSQLEAVSTEAEKKDQDNKLYQTARGKLPPPDVQISSFQSWDEVGAWYNGLQQERVKPSADVRAKAAGLTKDAKDDNAKLHAIYNYVSTQYHYIGVAFGIGRYQPHSADDVLANQYGDCKDKHTLLASLLDAAGIKASPALIGSLHELDPDVPSPAQFDHVITAVPQGSGYLWLDSTEEVAPFGYLFSILRDKPALVISEGKPAALVTTPAQPPKPALQTFKIDAKLDDSGTLKGTIERSVGGDDVEILFRTAFRRTPLTQWKDLVQQISRASGFGGDVSEVTASSPEKTDEPFHISYAYIRRDFPDWSDKRIAIALPPLISAAPDEKPSHPIPLSSMGEIRYESRIEVPKGYTPQLPSKINLIEDFAEYHSSYALRNGVIETHRQLLVKAPEIPLEKFEAFKKFDKVLSDDYDVRVGLMKTHVTPSSYEEAIWSLPYSDKEDANLAYGQAQEAFNKGDMEGEISALRHAVEIDPKFTRAWLWVADLYAYRHDQDHALDALHSAIANDPQQPLGYKGLGLTLMRARKFDDAIPVWQQLVKVAPNDSDGPEYLASTLFAAKRYAEAATAAEAAIKLEPDQAGLYMQLGSSYLRSGEPDKALTAYKKALEMDPQPTRFNDIGYELADANQQLSLSLQYAEKAVKDEEELSAKVTLPELKRDDLAHTTSLAAFWDTLGWVHFRLGNYAKAEKYLYPAWMLTQGPVEADHLGQVYEQVHKKDDAIRMYRLALAASRSPDQMKQTQARLEKLGGTLKTGQFGANGTEELNNLRTFQLQHLTSESESADFFLLFTQGGKIAEVKFVRGSDKLKSADSAIRAANVHLPFPDDGPTHVVRRGILGCYQVTGCTLVLINPFDVHSID